MAHTGRSTGDRTARRGGQQRPKRGDRRRKDRRNQQQGQSRTPRDHRRSGPPGRTRYRRALRREAPTVIGLLLEERDFTAMTRYRTFPFDNYGRYLHHLDGLLRSLHAEGTHIAVTLFDPEGYAAYCDSTGQPPDTPATRARYVAEAAMGAAAVRYTRQPIDALRAALGREADRRATWERATDELMDAGPCPDCGQDLAHCAFDAASHTLLRLIEAVGDGTHHMVCSLPVPDGPPLLAAVHIDSRPDGDLHVAEADALVVCTVMAVAAVTARLGGLVIRTTDAGGQDTVRGWELRGGEPRPLPEADVFDAYCTDPATGEPVPPEPGVRYAAGLPLPPPLPGDLL